MKQFPEVYSSFITEAESRNIVPAAKEYHKKFIKNKGSRSSRFNKSDVQLKRLGKTTSP